MKQYEISTMAIGAGQMHVKAGIVRLAEPIRGQMPDRASLEFEADISWNDDPKLREAVLALNRVACDYLARAFGGTEVPR